MEEKKTPASAAESAAIDSYYTSLVAHDMASGALAPRKPKYGDLDYYTYNEGESL